MFLQLKIEIVCVVSIVKLPQLKVLKLTGNDVYIQAGFYF